MFDHFVILVVFKGVKKKNVIDTPYESNIITFVEERLIRKYLVILVLLSVYND